MDTLNDVNASQAEVVDQPTEVSETDAVSNADEQSKASSVVAKRTQKQSWQDNQAFAEMRKRAEQAEAEQSRLRAEAERLSGLVGQQYGYTGTVTEVSDQLESIATGKDIAQIKAEREAEVQRSQQIADLEAKANLYEEMATKWFMSDLLAQVKDKFPDATIDSVEELGEPFINLIRGGVSPAHAYAAIKEVDGADEKPVPPTIGKVDSKPGTHGDFYTKEEVRRLSKDKTWVKSNFEKIRKSMSEW